MAVNLRPIWQPSPTPWTATPGDGIFDKNGRRIAGLSYAGKRISASVPGEVTGANGERITALVNTFVDVEDVAEFRLRLDEMFTTLKERDVRLGEDGRAPTGDDFNELASSISWLQAALQKGA